MSLFQTVKPREFRGLANRARQVVVLFSYGPDPTGWFEMPISRASSKLIADDAEAEGNLITVSVRNGGKKLIVGEDLETDMNPATGPMVELAAEEEEDEIEAGEDDE